MRNKMEERIFILATKKSQEYQETTYCIGVFKLGTRYMEFIFGETDNDRQYKQGDEVTYVYNANYTSNLKTALDWLNNTK